MREYYETFLKRNNPSGALERDLVKDRMRKDFSDLLKSSPNSVDITHSSIEERVVLISNKDTDTKVQKYILTKFDSSIYIGELCFCGLDTFLVMREETATLQGYRKFLVLECKHNIQWTDINGVVFKSPCYLVSGADRSLREDFKIVQQTFVDNAYGALDIIMPDTAFVKGQRLMVENTAWEVASFDNISVPGIRYINMAGITYNINYDTENLNDIDKLKETYIDVETTVKAQIGTDIQLNPVLYLLGEVQDTEFNYNIKEGNEFIVINNNVISGIAAGTSIVEVSSRNVTQEIAIDVQEVVEDLEIITCVGDDWTKPGMTKDYEFFCYKNGIKEAVIFDFEIEDSELFDYIITNNNVRIKTKKTNQLGIIEIKAKVIDKNLEFIKVITINSLWG